MLRPEGGPTVVSERTPLQECEMECYIPSKPLAVADLDAFFTLPQAQRPQTRRYVIQGEQLQLFILVRPPRDAVAAGIDISALSQLNVKVHFSDASAMKGILMLDKKKPRIMDDHPYINSVVSGEIAPPHTLLSDGTHLYAVQASMAVKDEFLNRLFHIVVTISLPTSSESTDLRLDASNVRSLLSGTTTVERNTMRTLLHEVELQQPLSVTFTRVVASSRTVVRIAAENKHPTLPLWLYDLQFLKNYTKLAREGSTSPALMHRGSETRLPFSDGCNEDSLALGDRKLIENLNFKEYFNIILETENFPIKLDSGEEYCFIATIEPLPGAYAKFFALQSRNFDSNVLLSWGMQALQGRVLSNYGLRWSAPECRDFLLSVSCKSPVLLNSSFSVCFTVTNLSPETQDLVITIGEQEAAGPVRRIADSTSGSAIQKEASLELDAAQVGKRSILCFQHAVELGPVKASSSVSVNVQYVALRDGVAQISELQIVDKISRRIFKTREVCDVYVLGPDDWREYEAAAGAAGAEQRATHTRTLSSSAMIPVATTSPAAAATTAAPPATSGSTTSNSNTLPVDAGTS